MSPPIPPSRDPPHSLQPASIDNPAFQDSQSDERLLDPSAPSQGTSMYPGIFQGNPLPGPSQSPMRNRATANFNIPNIPHTDVHYHPLPLGTPSQLIQSGILQQYQYVEQPPTIQPCPATNVSLHDWQQSTSLAQNSLGPHPPDLALLDSFLLASTSSDPPPKATTASLHSESIDESEPQVTIQPPDTVRGIELASPRPADGETTVQVRHDTLVTLSFNKQILSRGSATYDGLKIPKTPSVNRQGCESGKKLLHIQIRVFGATTKAPYKALCDKCKDRVGDKDAFPDFRAKSDIVVPRKNGKLLVAFTLACCSKHREPQDSEYCLEVVLNGVSEQNTPCFQYQLPYSFSVVSKRTRNQAEDLDAVDAVVPPPSKLPKTGTRRVRRVEKPVSQGAGPSGLDELSSGDSRGPTNNISSGTSDQPAAMDNYNPTFPAEVPMPSHRPHHAVAASDEETADGQDLIIEWVSPPRGPMIGGQQIFILGSNFPTDQMPLYASFGDNFARAVPQMPNALLCALPQASAPGWVPVTLRRSPNLNAPVMGTSLCKFEYVADFTEILSMIIRIQENCTPEVSAALDILRKEAKNPNLKTNGKQPLSSGEASHDEVETAIIQALAPLQDTLDFGEVISKTNEYKQTLAHFAVCFGYTRLLRRLVEWNIDLTIADVNGFTALHCAYKEGNRACVDLLLAKGASETVLDALGRAPSHLMPEGFASLSDHDADMTRTKRNPDAVGSDGSRAVIMRGRGPKIPITSTSSKAIILRHGRHGLWGEGKLATFRKLSGPEKLALKAEEVTRSLVIPPFNLDRLRRTAIGQFGEQIDKIRELRNVETFHDTVDAYIESHPRHKPQKEDKLPDFITKVIGSRIHNAYLLAAAWKVIRDALLDLKERDLKDVAVPSQLKCDDGQRDSYLLVWDCVSMLLECALQELKTDVAGSDALGKYFATTDAGIAAFSPTKALLMSAHRSLIDATILELVLPHSTYSPQILFAILSDALSTTPHEEVRKFSQPVVDNLGNLSILIEMRNMLEGPLLAAGKEGNAWKDAPRRDPEGEIDAFYDAIQKSSTVEPLKANRWRHLVWPLHQTKSETVLQELWEAVDAAYLDVTSHTVDELWQLEDDRHPRPQWSAWEIPELADYEDISSEEEEGSASRNADGAAARGSKGKSKKQKNVRPDALVWKKHTRGGENSYRQAITAGQGDDEDLLCLMSCSSTEVSDTDIEDGGGKNSDMEWGSDVESNYDFHENTVLEQLMKEAQDATSAAWKSDTEKKDSNPFIRLLSDLRGRVFDTDPTLRPSKMGPQPPAANPRPPSATVRARMQPQTNKVFALEMPDPAKGKRLQPSTPSKRNKEKEEDDLPFLVGEKVRAKATHSVGAAVTESRTPSTPLPKAPTARTAAGEVTVEEADDEGDVENEEAKKKRKRKKRPKKKEIWPTSQQVQAAVSPNGRTASCTQTSPTPSVHAHSTIDLSTFSGPSISLLAQPAPAIAQSARAYIASKGLDAEPKGKTKTRADPSTSSEQPPQEKKNGFFSHCTGKNKEREKEKDKEDEEDGEKKGRSRIELGPKSHLPNKAASLIGRVLGGKADVKKGQAGMKWVHFVKTMKLLGFREVRGTGGFSVRFDPPSDLDHPITFHKPHPGSTIHPKMLIKFGKRLKAHYGWDEEQFSAAVNPDFIDEDLD